jgi:inorganic pyrophosphatase
MTDNGEYDSKFIALPVQTHWKKINTLHELNHYYPGVMDILQIWLLNYKGTGRVKILSENDEKHARYSIFEAQ